jgi:hypothetical protein
MLLQSIGCGVAATPCRASLLLVMFVFVAFGRLSEAAERKLDGIVLVIADGASLELITAARAYCGG